MIAREVFPTHKESSWRCVLGGRKDWRGADFRPFLGQGRQCMHVRLAELLVPIRFMQPMKMTDFEYPLKCQEIWLRKRPFLLCTPARRRKLAPVVCQRGGFLACPGLGNRPPRSYEASE